MEGASRPRRPFIPHAGACCRPHCTQEIPRFQHVVHGHSWSWQSSSVDLVGHPWPSCHSQNPVPLGARPRMTCSLEEPVRHVMECPIRAGGIRQDVLGRPSVGRNTTCSVKKCERVLLHSLAKMGCHQTRPCIMSREMGTHTHTNGKDG